MYLKGMEEIFGEKEEGVGRGKGREEGMREKEKQQLKGQMTNWRNLKYKQKTYINRSDNYNGLRKVNALKI